MGTGEVSTVVGEPICHHLSKAALIVDQQEVLLRNLPHLMVAVF